MLYLVGIWALTLLSSGLRTVRDPKVSGESGAEVYKLNEMGSLAGRLWVETSRLCQERRYSREGTPGLCPFKLEPVAFQVLMLK